MAIKFLTLFDAPVKKTSPSGDPIYEWEYLDDQGNLQKDKKNVQEKIQSYLPKVDYKSQIARGELDLNGAIPNNHVDFTGLPDNTIDFYKHLINLANLDQEQIANILEQARSGDQESLQTEQATNSEAVGGGQITSKDVQDQSSDGAIDKNIIKGDK